MGSSACTTYPYYAAGAGNSWSGGTLYSGKTGDYIYRSKISITTPAFNGPSTKLIVSVTINGTSSPRGCYGVLQSNNNLTTSQVLGDGRDKNGYYDAPHPTVLSGCLGQSHACSNTSGSVVDGYNQGSGYTFYFIFDGVSLSPSTTYTVYVMKYCGWQNSSNGGWDTSSGWTSASSGGIGATIYYNDMYYFDLNGRLDGADAGGLSDSSGTSYGTCDVYINGSRVANNCGDHYTQYVYGSTYEIKDIKATTGHNYAGVVEGSTSGTITGNTGVRLAFNTNYVKLAYGPEGGIVTDEDYHIDEWGWISNGTNAFDVVYYGNGTDPYNATTFGLIKPGYTFANWDLNWTGTVLDQNTTYDSTVYANGSSTTANSTNFYTHLLARWTPNNYTINFDSSGGSAVSSQSVAYGNGNYTGLPTPTNTGKKFTGWYADIGTDGPINLGRDYKYPSSSGVGLTFEAYKDDWSTIGTETLVSCTNSGGWNLWFNNGVLIAEIYDTGLGHYQTITICNASDLAPGWHKFTMSLHTVNGIFIDVDGTYTFRGPLSSSLGYFENNCLWLGGEASHETTYYDGNQFSGLIKNFVIRNQYTNLTHSIGFAIPAQNITLYADWAPCDYMYVKVNNTWKLGRVIYKENGEWLLPSGLTNLGYTVTKPSGASYGFMLNANGYYESQNKGIANSAAVAQVRFTLDKSTTIMVECINYAESNFDFGIISTLGSTLTTTNAEDTTNVKQSFKGKQMATPQTVSFGTLAAGTYSFYIKFRKDSSVNSNNDSLQFRIVSG